MRPPVAALLASAALAACAPALPAQAPQVSAAAAPARQCFSSANVTGFQTVDDRSVDLTVGASRVFRVTLFGTCPDLRSAASVGVRARSGGSSFVCDDRDLDLIVPSSLGPQVCRAASVRRRTEAEVAAERAN